MKTDIQIAQEATMLPIKDVAANYGITEDDLELYGKYKAKFSDEFMNSLDEKPDGKLVLMTAINPTPFILTHINTLHTFSSALYPCPIYYVFNSSRAA